MISLTFLRQLELNSLISLYSNFKHSSRYKSFLIISFILILSIVGSGCLDTTSNVAATILSDGEINSTEKALIDENSLFYQVTAYETPESNSNELPTVTQETILTPLGNDIGTGSFTDVVMLTRLDNGYIIFDGLQELNGWVIRPGQYPFSRNDVVCEENVYNDNVFGNTPKKTVNVDGKTADLEGIEWYGHLFEKDNGDTVLRLIGSGDIIDKKIFYNDGTESPWGHPLLSISDVKSRAGSYTTAESGIHSTAETIVSIDGNKYLVIDMDLSAIYDIRDDCAMSGRDHIIVCPWRGDYSLFAKLTDNVQPYKAPCFTIEHRSSFNDAGFVDTIY